MKSLAETESQPDHSKISWSSEDVVVLVVWLQIPIGCFFARQAMLPVFADYSVSLNAFTRRLIYLPVAITLSIAFISVMLGACTITDSKRRDLFMRITGICGTLITVVYVACFVGPVFSFLHRLG